MVLSEVKNAGANASARFHEEQDLKYPWYPSRSGREAPPRLAFAGFGALVAFVWQASSVATTRGPRSWPRPQCWVCSPRAPVFEDGHNLDGHLESRGGVVPDAVCSVRPLGSHSL